ncbi:MAG: porin [Ahrensia sp.]|nr:porin [Ahrensia sp.]|tara:strand:- start:13915 stop:14604 length:690 start_codon:yes stop_codon:yes gene_type:complete
MRSLSASVSTLGLLICMSPAAQAADWLTAPTSLYDWSGTYLGAQVGYGGGSSSVSELDWPAGTLNQGPYSYDTDGFFGGIHAGHNVQSGSFVFGAEADLEYSGIDGTFAFGGGDFYDKHIRWTGSVRGRAGAAFDRVLVYATAGLAFASVNMKAIDTGISEISNTETAFGWTAGAGAEYAFDNLWSTRLEYRYADYGETSVSGSIYGGDFSYPTSNKVHAVRLGVSRKF